METIYIDYQSPIKRTLLIFLNKKRPPATAIANGQNRD
nr:MAG TPA: hypothetical protein [Caudoviricetes sp.]